MVVMEVSGGVVVGDNGEYDCLAEGKREWPWWGGSPSIMVEPCGQPSRWVTGLEADGVLHWMLRLTSSLILAATSAGSASCMTTNCWRVFIASLASSSCWRASCSCCSISLCSSTFDCTSSSSSLQTSFSFSMASSLSTWLLLTVSISIACLFCVSISWARRAATAFLLLLRRSFISSRSFFSFSEDSFFTLSICSLV